MPWFSVPEPIRREVERRLRSLELHVDALEDAVLMAWEAQQRAEAVQVWLEQNKQTEAESCAALIDITASGCGENPLPGVTLTVTDGGGIVWTATTDVTGRAQFSGLSVGDTTIEANHSRFAGSITVPLTTVCDGSYAQAFAMASLPITDGYVCTTVCSKPVSKSILVTMPDNATYQGATTTCAWTTDVLGQLWQGLFSNSTGDYRVTIRENSGAFQIEIDIWDAGNPDFGIPASWVGFDGGALSTACNADPITMTDNAHTGANCVEQ